MKFDQVHFGRCIKAYRDAEGYSVRLAAYEAGISPSALNRVEHGHMPSLPHFVALCRWAGFDPLPLLGYGVRRCEVRETTAPPGGAGPA